MPGRIAPIADELAKPFWEGTKDGRLLIQRCPTTGQFQWYPRLHSRHDWSATPEWVESSGRGRIHSFSVIHRAPTSGLAAPYVFAVVELEEGVLLTANIVDVSASNVEVGMEVRVVFEVLEDGNHLPVFSAG